MNAVLEGAFIGGIIYFVIYYEVKVSAIYQLFYLICLLVAFMQLSNYDYSYMLSNGIGNAVINILQYCIPWIVFLILDRCIHNEKAKMFTMCIIGIIWFPMISEFLCYGYFYPTVNLYNCIKWIGIAVTVFGLAYFKKNKA